MPIRKTSLRLRLVIGFLLVSVPAMLTSAYVAARLISSAFEANVEQWLGETSRFFMLEVTEATQEAQRVASVVGHRLETSVHGDLRRPKVIEREFALLSTVGYDLIAIYDDRREMLFTSRDFTSSAALPTETSQGIFKITTGEENHLMAGAVQSVQVNEKPAYVLVGTWLDDSYLGSIKVVTSLDVRLFAETSSGLEAVMLTHPDDTRTVPDAIRERLAKGEDTIFDREADDGAYRAVYTAFRGIDGKLAAVAFIGLPSGADFFEQLGPSQLFIGIFLLGSLISIIVGAAMSGILVKPLRALTRGVRAIAAGDFKQRVPETGGREIAQLAAGFNGMAEQLGKLHALETELRRRDRLSALGQAAMVIAHEVRNPLGIIKTSTEVVRNRAKLGVAEDRMLGYVIEEVRRIETLVRDFLDFAQPKAPSKTVFPFRAVIDRVASIAMPELDRHGIVLDIKDRSGGGLISGDPDQLHQAGLNLVLNAIDAMPAGGVITAEFTSSNGEISLTISDQGDGVAEEIRGEIFNPFITTKTKGTGLGLAKVQSVAAAHGGRAHYASPAGQGASFTITLPLLERGAS
ncbi:ATP-binding protein [Bosea sp. 2KB_26]|uniref:sensor histidine kinase n=1 Tax=Bosea sp. 2KB_26 TaxID=3237475 RepID=UPI003F904BEE